MKPGEQSLEPHDDLFRSRLDNIINMKHELVALSKKIDWTYLNGQAGEFFADQGRPAHPTRLMAGLPLLKYMFNLSDEAVCERWIYDPYFQYFTGSVYFEHEFPIARSDMTHWRQRMGDEFCVKLLQESLRIAYQEGALRTKDLKRIVVDTTVQEKVITHPTEAKLLYKALTKLGESAKAAGIHLRQSYVRVGKLALIKSGRYRHAKQMKRAKKQGRFLKVRLGRLLRDIERKEVQVNNEASAEKLLLALNKAKQILHQKQGDSNYCYAWHCPEVECIGKEKAHKPYEFGVKVSITTNVNRAPGGHFILHAKALAGRPYDGHTLKTVLNEMQEQTGLRAERCYVDKGYRGHGIKEATHVYQSGQRRGVTAAIKKELRRLVWLSPSLAMRSKIVV